MSTPDQPQDPRPADAASGAASTPPGPPTQGDPTFTPLPHGTTAEPDPARFISPNSPEALQDEIDFQEIERSPDVDVVALHGRELSATGSGNPGSIPVPPAVLAWSGLVVLLAGLYLGLFSAGFKSDNYDERPGQKAAAGGPVQVDLRTVGQKLFVGNCAQCHQTSGQGVAGQFPPLVASEWVVGDAPNRLPQILLHGIQGGIHVKGQVYNGQMPAWNQLSDLQIAAVLTYIRSEWGNSGTPVPKEAITEARKQTGARSEAWNESELLAIAPAAVDGAGAKPPVPASPAGGAAPGAGPQSPGSGGTAGK